MRVIAEMDRAREVEIGRDLYRLAGGRGRASRGLRIELAVMIRTWAAGLDEFEPYASTGEWLARRGLVALRPNPARRGGSRGTRYIATITPTGRALLEQAESLAY